jgi:CPA1 family monovalent cation:H+ antiporter
MRGIVTLVAALALPGDFPFRNLIVFTGFSVVLGTLVLQGLTLEPLLRALDLHDDDPVGQELAARDRALRAELASLERHDSALVHSVRDEFTAHLSAAAADPGAGDDARAARAARQAVLSMRASDEIGDDAFHRMEEELDCLEMAGGRSS